MKKCCPYKNGIPTLISILTHYLALYGVIYWCYSSKPFVASCRNVSFDPGQIEWQWLNNILFAKRHTNTPPWIKRPLYDFWNKRLINIHMVAIITIWLHTFAYDCTYNRIKEMLSELFSKWCEAKLAVRLQAFEYRLFKRSYVTILTTAGKENGTVVAYKKSEI